jgi:hypothetical protein
LPMIAPKARSPTICCQPVKRRAGAPMSLKYKVTTISNSAEGHKVPQVRTHKNTTSANRSNSTTAH